MLNKILVANRGEIAIRIMRACRELGITSVAIYSDADKESLFSKYAEEAYYLGPSRAADSYLNIKRIIGIAEESKADGIHPGYGFLAENPNFAYACEKAGIKFIGPSSRVIELMGNKLIAREVMQKAGVPVVPGTNDSISNLKQAKAIARDIGYPVIIKPSGGGGGIGMKIVNNEAELQDALQSATAIANNTFGIGEVYIEKYLEHPRHIEFQILADAQGNAVHLGERECSIQRRHQKIIEESPSVVFDAECRNQIGQLAVQAVRSVKYEGAGTLEFLFSNGKIYFLEMNTRVQVEHPVTEIVTGIDIVKEQIRIASGLSLGIKQCDIEMRGWAIECRINAEDPMNNFAPSTGKLSGYRSPGGIGIRVDSGVHTRYTIPHMYDPMISKLIVWGRDRNEAIARMRRALYEYIIVGVKTNIPFHKAVMENPSFIRGELGTQFIDEEAMLLREDMQRIMQREKPLEEKLSQIFEQRKKVAAVSAIAAAAQVYGQQQMR